MSRRLGKKTNIAELPGAVHSAYRRQPQLLSGNTATFFLFINRAIPMDAPRLRLVTIVPEILTLAKWLLRISLQPVVLHI